jgi:hypothetical protein
MEQTRRSPRAQAISVRNSVSPSIESVLARRCRRGTAIEAASTTWLSMRRINILFRRVGKFPASACNSWAFRA